MSIPLHIAQKLLRLSQGETLPFGMCRHPVIEELIAESIVERNGRIKKTVRISNAAALASYLKNKLSINELTLYIEALSKQEITRSELAAVSSDSKLRNVRTFKGFLVNSYEPINCTLNDKPFTVFPADGTFYFVHDYERFVPHRSVTIVGVENSEIQIP